MARVETLAEAVGVADGEDFFKFTTTGLAKLTANLTGLTNDADLVLLKSDGSTPLGFGTNAGSTSEAIVFDNLAAGSYYLKVQSVSGSTTYNLTVAATTPNPLDGAGNSLGAARALTAGAKPLVVLDAIGYGAGASLDKEDWYSFVLASSSLAPSYVVNLGLAGLSADADLTLWQRTASGSTTAALASVIADAGSGIDDIAFAPQTLAAGTYYVQIVPHGEGVDRTAYNLSLQAALDPDEEANDSRAGTTAGLLLGTGSVSAATLTATSTGSAVAATRREFVGALDPEDWFRIVLAGTGTAAPHGINVSMSLTGLAAGADADLELVDWTGAVVARSSVAGSGAEGLAANGLSAGADYYVHVLAVAGDTGYTVKLDAKLGTADEMSDEFPESFDFGGASARSFEDTGALFDSPAASWGGGRLSAAFDFDGDGGPGGTFDWVVQDGDLLVVDTDGGAVVAADGVTVQALQDGRLDVRDWTIGDNAVVRVQGSRPFRVNATGNVIIRGLLDLSGFDAQNVVVPNTGNVVELGGRGGPGRLHGELCGPEQQGQGLPQGVVAHQHQIGEPAPAEVQAVGKGIGRAQAVGDGARPTLGHRFRLPGPQAPEHHVVSLGLDAVDFAAGAKQPDRRGEAARESAAPDRHDHRIEIGDLGEQLTAQGRGAQRGAGPLEGMHEGAAFLSLDPLGFGERPVDVLDQHRLRA